MTLTLLPATGAVALLVGVMFTGAAGAQQTAAQITAGPQRAEQDMRAAAPTAPKSAHGPD